MDSRGPVLVTGCSTGIGRATAELLVRSGHTVYATARRPETLAGLESLGARTLPLDVTSEESMVAAVRAVEAEHGHVGTLVNNAGYGEYAPVEEADLEGVRRMFETNFFGLSRMVQLVLPAMRAAGTGRIVNVGSMGGRIVFPVGGYYHATKHAVDALTVALRQEVRPFGIDVVLLEPGPIRTRFEETINATIAEHTPDEGSAYAGLVAAVQRANASGYSNPLTSAGPEAVAKAIRRAVEARRPRRRYVVTPTARVLIHARRLGGDRVWEQIVRRSYG